VQIHTTNDGDSRAQTQNWPKRERAAGLTSSFEEFYRGEYAQGLALAHALVGNRYAEDLLQESFWATFERWDQISFPRAWFRRVLINRCTSWLRRARTEDRRLRLLAGTELYEVAESPDPELWSLIRRLPRRQLWAVVLHYVDGAPTNEVAEIIGCSEPTARVHLHRARKRLAMMLETEEPDG
jgi:RNA polymerase sigma factor (sigma-70 family)